MNDLELLLFFIRLLLFGIAIHLFLAIVFDDSDNDDFY